MKNPNPDTAQCKCACHSDLALVEAIQKHVKIRCQHCTPKEECKQELLCHGKANRSGYCNECGEELCDPTPKEQSQGWEEEFNKKFVNEGASGGFDLWREWLTKYTDEYRQIENIKLFIRNKLTYQLETLEKQVKEAYDTITPEGFEKPEVCFDQLARVDKKLSDVLDCISTLKKEV